MQVSNQFEAVSFIPPSLYAAALPGYRFLPQGQRLGSQAWENHRSLRARSAAEMVRGLDDTWAFIDSRLQRWTPADCAKTFPDEWDGQIYEVSRSWVIYHVLEHDLHHGSEVSLILGMNGLPGLDL